MTDDETYWLSRLAPGVAVVAAVVEEESMTRAAARLGMPQPTVTRSVARLSRELGVELVERRGRRVVATPAGRAMLEHLRRARAAVADARAAVVDVLDPEAGQVRLGFLHSLGARDVPVLVAAYRRAHAGVRFALRQGSRDDVLAAVGTGDLDLALVGPLPDGDERFAVKPLRSEPLLLTVPLGHRFASRGRVDLAECAAEPFVLLTRGHGLRLVTDALFAEAGIDPPVAFEGEDVDTLRGLVSAGLGIALAESGRAPGTVELVLSRPRAVRTVGVVWNRDRVALPVARRFRDHVVAEGPRLLARRPPDGPG